MKLKACTILIIWTVAASIIVSANSTEEKYAKGIYAELNTNKGLIVLLLEFKKVPMTTANFVGLAEGTIKNSALPDGVSFILQKM